jgi:hypothetical protein
VHELVRKSFDQVFSVVTSGSNDNDAAIDEHASGNAKRVVFRRIDCRHAETQIYNANVVS